MKISNIAIKRPVTVMMLVMMIIVLGMVSFSGLPLDMLPDISYPAAIVITEYNGAGPRGIEELVSIPLEKAMGTVDGFKKVSSTSSNGISTVMIEFNQGTDMDFAALDMREKIDMVKGVLPEGASDPIIFQFDTSMIPVMQLGLSGSGNLTDLKIVAEEKVQNRIEGIKGVAAVEIVGGLEREISISILPNEMQGYGLSLAQLIQVLRSENITLPGGQLREGMSEFTVRTTGEFSSISEIENLPIATSAGVIHLKDIAVVEDGYKDTETFVYLNDKPCVMLQIQKQSGFNTVMVADAVNAELEKIKQELDGVHFETIFDQSDFIKQSLSSVANNALIGGILAILILFIFLKNIRTTIIIGAAIPISIIATFILIYFSGITLNIMSLGGLALGIGMLVDNSIVVLESIYRYREEGYGRIESAGKGSEEVAMAVTASTLTTIAVFLPVAFIKDNFAIEIFRELALTVTFSLLASLIVALTLVPMMASKILKIVRFEELEKKKNFISLINRGFEKAFAWIEDIYGSMLKWSIGHRKTIIFSVIILFVVSIFTALIFTGAEFFPTTDEGMFTISIDLPKGTIVEETEKIVTTVEDRISSIEDIEYLFAVLGNNGDPSFSTIYGSFGPVTQREKGIDELLDDIRSRFKDIPGAIISVDKMSFMSMGGGSMGGPIAVNIEGDDLGILYSIAEELVEKIGLIEGTRGVTSSAEETIPEAQVTVNRDRAAQYGISAYSIAETVQTSIMGSSATRYKIEGEEIDVRVRLAEDKREHLNALYNIMINSPLGIAVPLYEISEIKIVESPAAINRNDQVRTVSVTGDITGRDSYSVFADIQTIIDNMEVPTGYNISLGGEHEDMMEAFYGFGLVFVLAIILVYMIMASQFESLVHPFTIMFSVPLAFIGVSFAMSITGKPFSVPAFAGIVMLAGIAVNNAIVLIDYINQLRNRGMERNEAIFKAGSVRLRPIMMTTLTTVLGVVPLALGIGEGAEFQAPMAITIIGGLSFSTLLTLVLIPVLYTLFDDFSTKIKGLYKKKTKQEVML